MKKSLVECQRTIPVCYKKKKPFMSKSTRINKEKRQKTEKGITCLGIDFLSAGDDFCFGIANEMSDNSYSQHEQDSNMEWMRVRYF